MASEFVLGMHGEITFDDQQLAGLYPHDQVKLVESVGADIFGPAINVNTSKSFPWNLAKCRVADLLDIDINSVKRYKSLMV